MVASMQLVVHASRCCLEYLPEDEGGGGDGDGGEPLLVEDNVRQLRPAA